MNSANRKVIRKRAASATSLSVLVVVSVCNSADLVSVNADGTDSGNGFSSGASISADGTKVVFLSQATDLGPTDTNGHSDAYVRDLESGITMLISVNSDGTDSGNNRSSLPFISADGTKVVFTSFASDLGPTDTNGLQDIYVRDLLLSKTILVSVNNDGLSGGNGSSATAVMSADGTKVAFVSSASDLGPTDTNGLDDIYLRDLVTGTTTLVSANSDGSDSGNFSSFLPAISADGTKVAFISGASNLGPTDTNGFPDVYVRDLNAGVTSLASVNSSGSNSGNGVAFRASISADGTKVAFSSSANDFGPTDTNGFHHDIYVRDLNTGVITLASVNGDGSDSGNRTVDPFLWSLSADGTKVVFISFASDLVPIDTNELSDAFVHDLNTGTTALISVNSAESDSGNQGAFGGITISADGAKVAFRSRSNDLGATDTNGVEDIYVRDLNRGVTTLVSVSADGCDTGNSASTTPTISSDGTTVMFRSRASNLVPTDTNAQGDVFVSVDVITLIKRLSELVVDSNLQNGIANSFDAKLDAVEKALVDANANNDGAAASALQAFVAAVEAQRGTKLTDTQADELLAAAKQILNLLLCT